MNLLQMCRFKKANCFLVSSNPALSHIGYCKEKCRPFDLAFPIKSLNLLSVSCHYVAGWHDQRRRKKHEVDCNCGNVPVDGVKTYDNSYYGTTGPQIKAGEIVSPAYKGWQQNQLASAVAEMCQRYTGTICVYILLKECWGIT